MYSMFPILKNCTPIGLQLCLYIIIWLYNLYINIFCRMIGLVSFGREVIYVFLSFVHRPHNTFVTYKVKTDLG